MMELTRPLEIETSSDAARHEGTAVFEVRNLSVSYGDNPAIADVTLDIYEHKITALIGPSGCGKSSLIRCLNRMNDLIPTARVGGSMRYHGTDLYAPEVDPVEVRRRIGMVFQQPNPFPMSIFDNVAYALREQGSRRARRATLEPAVREALERAGMGHFLVHHWGRANRVA